MTSAFAPDLEHVRAWLGKMIAALRFVEMITAIVALLARMHGINTELVKQMAHLRRARPRSETLERLGRQLALPLFGEVAIATPKPGGETQDPKRKSRRGRHPGRGAPSARLERVEVLNRVPPEPNRALEPLAL